MVKITRYPLLAHLRSEPNRHVLHWSRGRLRHSGRGLAYWFRPLTASVAEVPCDDREQAFLFQGRSADFQDVHVQGALTWRVVDPELVADRIDFSIDMRSGDWAESPVEQLGEMLLNQAQQYAWDAVASQDVRTLLERGVESIREAIRAGLAQAEGLESLGIEVVAVAISKVSPTSELERALQAPANESIQQQADEAVFRRRALAVEKERAIAENELQNQIELASREADLIAQRGENHKRTAREKAEADRIEMEGSVELAQLSAASDAENQRLSAETDAETLRLRAAAKADQHRAESSARADGIRAVEEASIVAERERMEIYAGLEPKVMLGLAAREFAGKLERIEHLNVGPDMLSQLFSDFLEAGAGYLGRGKDADTEGE